MGRFCDLARFVECRHAVAIAEERTGGRSPDWSPLLTQQVDWRMDAPVSLTILSTVRVHSRVVLNHRTLPARPVTVRKIRARVMLG